MFWCPARQAAAATPQQRRLPTDSPLFHGIARTIFIVSTLTVQTRASRAITGSLWSAIRQVWELGRLSRRLRDHEQDHARGRPRLWRSSRANPPKEIPFHAQPGL